MKSIIPSVVFTLIACSVVRAEEPRVAFLVPVPEEVSWHEMAYLATIPAAAKVNDGVPVVVAMNGLGSINRQVRHYLDLYKPEKVVVVGERFEPIGTWASAAKTDVQGIAGGRDRALSAWVKLNPQDAGGGILSWGRAGAGRKWSLGVQSDGTLAIDIGGALKAGTSDLRDGKWHHVGAVMTKVEAPMQPTTAIVHLYVDGAKEPVGFTSDKVASSLSNKLTGYWKMNEGFGGTSADSTAFGQTLDLQWEMTPPGFIDGKFDKGLRLNGTGQRFFSEIFQPRDRDHRDTIQEVSASVWFKPAASEGTLIGTHSTHSAPGGGWKLKMIPGNRVAVEIECQKDDAEYIFYNKSLVKTHLKMSSGTLDDQKWHHAAFTYKDGQASLFVDGKKEASSAVKGIGITAFFPMRIGASFYHGTVKDYFTGHVDEAAIWSRELSEADISELYNDGQGVEIDLTASRVNTASTPVTTGFGSFGGEMKELALYDRALSDNDMDTLSKHWLTYEGAEEVPGGSAPAVAASLATRFWSQAPTVVLCDEDNYTMAMSASCLAARMRVPLLFPGSAAAAAIKGLGAQRIIFIGKEAPEVPPGMKFTHLKNGKQVLRFMVQEGMDVEYFAVANPNDRSVMEVKKGSLAAVVLAAGRKGIVLPLAYQTQWRRPGNYDEVVTSRPEGVDRAERSKSTYPFELKSADSVNAPSTMLAVDGQVGGLENTKKGIQKRPAFLMATKGSKVFNRLLVDMNKDKKIDDNEIFKKGDILDFGGKHGTRFMKLAGISQTSAELVNTTWQLGTLKIGNREYRIASWETTDKTWEKRSITTFSGDQRTIYPMFCIDLNRNGRFGDRGEGPYHSCGIVKIGSNPISITVGKKGSIPGDFDVTYPAYPMVRDDILEYVNALGRPPQYLCIVGMPDTIPFALIQCREYPNIPATPTDLPYADTDADPYAEMAFGRLLGSDRTSLTLTAVRSLTYEQLIGDPDLWARRTLGVCGYGGRDWSQTWLSKMMENIGMLPLENYEKETTDLPDFGMAFYKGHGGPGGHDGFNSTITNMLAPAFMCSGSACNTTGIDQDKIENLISPHMLDSGAITHFGCARPGGWSFAVNEQAMWYELISGKPQGEAYRHSLSVQMLRMAYEMQQPVSGPENHYDDNHTIHWYDLTCAKLYGDPAVQIYRSNEMKKKGPRVEPLSKDKLRLLGPEVYWTHKNESGKGKPFIYSGAPGLFKGDTGTGLHALAQWTTSDKSVVGVKQITQTPDGFGMLGTVGIDEHWDGTRTLFWLVRLEQFDAKTGTFKQRFDQLDYEILRR